MKGKKTPHIPCPVCDRTNILPVIRMENIPVLCNVLYSSAREAKSAAKEDIELVLCRHCTHLFNSEFKPDSIDYQPGYENSLHHSPRYREYAERQAKRLLDTYNFHGQRVIDIGCGKGEFLQLFARLGNCRGTGFEPAAAPAVQDSKDTTRIIADSFSDKYFDNQAELYVSRHVLEHLPDPVHFLSLIRSSIGSRNGVVFLEIPDGTYVLEHCSVWDIIYEHFSYFTPHSLTYLLVRAGFRCAGTVRCFADQFLAVDAFPEPSSGNQKTAHPDNIEKGAITSLAEHFTLCYGNRYTKVNELLKNHKRPGNRIVLWGGGSKGISLVNQLDDPDMIECLVDVNPEKQGKYIPGSGHQVVAPEFLRDFQPDVVLIANDIYMQEIQEYLYSLNVKARIHSI